MIVANPETLSTGLQDRRLSERHSIPAVLSVAWLHFQDKSYPVELLDESEGGVRAEIKQVPPNTHGRWVVVERLLDEIVQRRANVRHVRAVAEDCWHLGLEWVDHEP